MKYNAFISYSHRQDSDLAPCLERGLEKFAKPTFKRRALNIFRDSNDLSASPDLWGKIEEGLKESDYFIFLASPPAAQSRWCKKEVDYWKANKSIDHFLVVLTEGELFWDEAKSDFDWTKTTAIPENLSGAFKNEPLYVDFRGKTSVEELNLSNADFKTKLVLLAATLHGKAVGDMVGEGVKQHKRTLRIRNSAISILSLLLVTAGMLTYFALQQKGVAEEQTQVAKQRALEAEEAKAATEHQLILTKLKSFLVQSRSNEELNPLLAFRIAEKGYKLSKANNLDATDFENQLIKVVYSKRLFQLNDLDTYIVDRTTKSGVALTHTLKAVRNNKFETPTNSIIEMDASGNQVFEYSGKYWNAGWHDPFFSDDGNFVVVSDPPEGGEVSGSGFILFRHKGEKISSVYARHYSYPFHDCPFFFDQGGNGVIILKEDYEIIGYPLHRGVLETDKAFRLQGYGEKTSAIALSPSGYKFASASEDGKVTYYPGISMLEPYKNSKGIEFVAHHNDRIKEIAFCNNETVLKTVTETETKYWPLVNKSLDFEIRYNKDFKFTEPYTGEEIQFQIDYSKWGQDTVGSFRLNNKSLSTNLGEILIWLDMPNHDNDPFMGDLTADGRYMYANSRIYPLGTEVILKLVNEHEALGKLMEIDLDETKDDISSTKAEALGKIEEAESTQDNSNTSKVDPNKNKTVTPKVKPIEEKVPVAKKAIIAVDNLRVRNTPALDSETVTNLKINASVSLLGEQSANQTSVTIGGKEITDYWHKIKTAEGIIGWIHGCCFKSK